MSRREFPRFSAHAKASCFQCEGDFGEGYPFASGHARGRGAWLQACEKCGFTTWYDLAEELES